MSWFHRDLFLANPPLVGPDVGMVEKRLGLPTTRVYSGEVIEKVRAFQAKHGLLVTGEVDHSTHLALEAIPRAGLLPDWFPEDKEDAARERLGLPPSDNLDAALVRYQAAVGLPITGEVDEATAISLGS